MKLIPTNGRLIVKEIAQTQSSILHIVRTEDSADKFVRGEVLEASDGFYSITGIWIDAKVKKGDKVWYNRFNGAEMTINRATIVLLDKKEVLIVERDEE